ncbi:MAG TPA: deoxyribonuclease IV [Candidatus Limnocylindrales bacterium]|nr:deoxyribonuclease IV [Candidatus Limnocylindrales bacterium]
MHPDGRRIGAHLALGQGMLEAAERAVMIGATAVQVFSDSPTTWARRSEPPPDLAPFRARLAAAGIAPLVIHGSYLINLAGEIDELRTRSIELLVAELEAATAYGAGILNIHVGAHRGGSPESAIDRLAGGLAEALATPAAGIPTGVTITLENSPGGDGALGADIDGLAAIAGALDTAGIPRSSVAFCLDTAHAWGAGHDLASPAATDDLLEQFDRRIGLDRLRLVHLNDSRAGRGSRLDRHEHLGAGRIGESGLGHLLRHPLLAGATFILETPGMDAGYDAINLERARALLRGDPLGPLPAEAFALGGSRTRAASPASS